jgi:hypothetical protein
MLGWASPVQPHRIASVGYDKIHRVLQIETLEKLPVTVRKVRFLRSQKMVTFRLPDVTLAPSPRVIMVNGDPLVKDVTLVQEGVEAKPVVSVTIHLQKDVPASPFMITPTTTGGVMAAVMQSTPTSLASATSGDLFLSVAETSPSTPTGVMITSPAPATLPLSAPLSAPEPIHPTLIVPVSEEKRLTEIDDMMYDAADHALIISAGKAAIVIQRTFLLPNPSRYVVDLVDAKLDKRLTERLIGCDYPGIQHIRAGQFDATTVRLVVQYKPQTPVAVSMTPGNQNRTLTLHFSAPVTDHAVRNR